MHGAWNTKKFLCWKSVFVNKDFQTSYVIAVLKKWLLNNMDLTMDFT